MQATPDDGLWKVRSTWDNFGKFIHQFQPETRKLERILIKIISTKYVFII